MKTKRGTTKSRVFWVTFIFLIGLYIFTLLISENAFLSIGSMIIGGLVFAGFGYQGTNVADNALKGKFYREELSLSEVLCKWQVII